MSADIMTPPSAPEQKRRNLPRKWILVILAVLLAMAAIVVPVVVLTGSSPAPSGSAGTSVTAARTDAGRYMLSHGYKIVQEYTGAEFQALSSDSQMSTWVADAAVGTGVTSSPSAVIHLTAYALSAFQLPGAWDSFMSGVNSSNSGISGERDGSYVILHGSSIGNLFH